MYTMGENFIAPILIKKEYSQIVTNNTKNNNNYKRKS